jgi:hypothetical protein
MLQKADRTHKEKEVSCSSVNVSHSNGIKVSQLSLGNTAKYITMQRSKTHSKKNLVVGTVSQKEMSPKFYKVHHMFQLNISFVWQPLFFLSRFYSQVKKKSEEHSGKRQEEKKLSIHSVSGQAPCMINSLD